MRSHRAVTTAVVGAVALATVATACTSGKKPGTGASASQSQTVNSSLQPASSPATTPVASAAASQNLPPGSSPPASPASSEVASASPSLQPGFPPVVTHTGKPPTGYTVTFHYRGPSVTPMRIKGEWYFSDPKHTTTTKSQGLLPTQWAPGDIPIDYPNATVANWPVATMTKGADGVWSYTTPLPSGVYSYGFLVNCVVPDGTGCAETADPSNPPWNVHNGTPTGSVENVSQVYVPSDPAFKSVDYSWQAPNPVHGTLTDVSYTSPGSVDPVGTHYVAIYTPPGYDPHRATPYPTLYLLPGYTGVEIDWSTAGDATNIVDNLIDSQRVQPMVVVMPNPSGFADDCTTDQTAAATQFADDLLNNVIPYVQAHYDVASAANRRAFAGLSCGGGFATALLVNHTTAFDSFGVFSPFPALNSLTSAQATAVKGVRVFLGVGLQDPIYDYTATELATLRASGIHPSTDFVDGGHEWHVWRILLRDFLSQVAFQPPGG